MPPYLVFRKVPVDTQVLALLLGITYYLFSIRMLQMSVDVRTAIWISALLKFGLRICVGSLTASTRTGMCILRSLFQQPPYPTDREITELHANIPTLFSIQRPIQRLYKIAHIVLHKMTSRSMTVRFDFYLLKVTTQPWSREWGTQLVISTTLLILVETFHIENFWRLIEGRAR